MSRNMITLLPDGKTFEAEKDELLLDAALRQGVPVPYSCRSGTCRTCLYRVTQGDVKQLEPEFCFITHEELHEGRRLLCMSIANSDSVMESGLRRRKKQEE